MKAAVSRRRLILLLTMAFCIGVLGSVGGQDLEAARTKFFQRAEENFGRAEEENLKMLAPSDFEQASKLYSKAKGNFDKGRQLKGIERDLNRSLTHLESAFKTAELSRVALKDLIEVRNEAKKANLPQRFHIKPEKLFVSAAGKVEKQNLKGAQRDAQRAITEYRSGTIEFLRKDLVGDALRKVEREKKGISRETYNSTKAELQGLRSYLKGQGKQSFSIADLVEETESRIKASLDKAQIRS